MKKRFYGPGENDAISYVSKNGYRLSGLPDVFRSNVDVVYAAVMNYPEGFRFARGEARENFSIRSAVFRADPGALRLMPI